MNKQSEKHIFWAATFLGLLGFISLNIYLPALPTLIHQFHTNPPALKLSITLFLLGFALSQFFWGSFSSKHGRKKAIFYGLIVAEFGTFCALCSLNIEMFNLARLIEGIGIGSASVLSRALFTDALDQTKLAKALSLVSSAGNIMPAIAPLIGGYLILFFNWRMIFLLLFIYTTALIIIFHKFVNETNANIHNQFTFKQALSEYYLVFTNRNFIGYALPFFILSGGMIGYYAATPFIYITNLHISAHNYSYLLIFTVTWYAFGANLSGYFIKKLGLNKTIFLGILISLISALLFFSLAYFAHFSILTTILPMMIYMFGAGLVAPSANAKAMNELRHIAGASAAVVGALVYGMSTICTAFITTLDLTQLVSLGIYTIIISVTALFGFWGLILSRK